VLVRSEIKLPRFRRLSAQERSKLEELRRDYSSKRESSMLTPTTRERRDPTSVPARRLRSQASERFLFNHSNE
jgi:hypothetical protein